MSDSLRPHDLQHARPPCPSPTPGVHSDSCSSSQWCHPAISSSVIPFFSCPQFLPASKSFPMSQLFTWGGQSTGVSALASDVESKCYIPENSHNFIQQFYLKVRKLEVNDHYHPNRPHSHHPSNSTKKKAQQNKEVSKTQVKDRPKLVIGVNYWRMLMVKKIN